MSGMNLIFHLIAAAAAVCLVMLWLQMQRQRDLLRLLIASQQPGGKARLVVEDPWRFLKRAAAATGTEAELDGPSGAPQRLVLAPLAELLLRHEIRLLRYQQDAAGKAQLAVCADSASGLEATLPELVKALGGRVEVVLEPAAPRGV